MLVAKFISFIAHKETKIYFPFAVLFSCLLTFIINLTFVFFVIYGALALKEAMDLSKTDYGMNELQLKIN